MPRQARNRSRGWCFTINNYTEQDITYWIEYFDSEEARYVPMVSGAHLVSLLIFNFLDTPFRRNEAKRAPHIYREPYTLSNRSPFQHYTNYNSKSTGNAPTIFELPFNIVPILKNAAGVSFREDSPSPSPKCKCCRSTSSETGNEKSLMTSEDHPTIEQ